MTFFDPRERDIFGGTSQTTVDWVKKVATETNNQQALDIINKQEQEKIRDTMLGTNTSTGTTTQATGPKTATGTVGGTPQSASPNKQTASTIGSPKTTNTSGSIDKANAAVTPVINPLVPKSNTPAYTDIAGQKDYAKTMGDQLGSGQSGTDGKSYLAESLDQLVRGNYSGDVTALGTTLQVLSGILGLDTAADVRDLYYDVTHWDGSKEHIIQTLLDVVGLIPVVGSLKYADEVGTLVKQGLKGADEAGEAAATAAKTAPKRVYELPAGYKPSPLMTDDEAKEFVARGWFPQSTKPSPIATDDEIKQLLELEKREGLPKPLSNAVEEVGAKEIAAKSGSGYNGGEGLAEDLGEGVVSKLGPPTKEIREKFNNEGLTQDKIDKIVSLPKNQKPMPDTYLSKKYLEEHKQSFRNSGVVKIMPTEPKGTIGGKGGTFVMSGDQLDNIIRSCREDISKIEDALGFDKGYLGKNPVIVEIQEVSGLRLPQGNELGALSDYWLPGGYTSGGIKEAVIDPAPVGTYTFRYLF